MAAVPPAQSRAQSQRSMPGSLESEDLDRDDEPEQGLQLAQKELQYWALGLWSLVLPLVLFGTHKPLSCVSHTDEEARSPARCHGLLGDPVALRLRDFCWESCTSVIPKIVVLSIALGLVMQAVVVIFNHDGCQGCLRLRWFFDLSDVLSDIQERSSGAGFLVRHPLRRLGAMSRRVLTKNSTQSLNPGRVVSRVSRAFLLNALFCLCFFMSVGANPRPVHFECTDSDGDLVTVGRPSSIKWGQVLANAAALLLLLVISRLESQAAWTLQIKVFVEDPEELVAQFNQPKHSGSLSDAPYYAREDPGPGYGELKKAFLLQLVKVEHDGILQRPSEIGSVTGDVVLHFQKPPPQPSPDRLHRKWALRFLFSGAVLLFSAANVCWVCVRRIRGPPGTTILELDKRFMLMGACGRPHGTGETCALASGAIILAILQQLIMMYAEADGLENTGVKQSAQMPGYQQLSLRMLDMRRNVVLDPQWYLDAGARLPSVPCHVWVKKNRDEESARECDCSDTFWGRYSKQQWQRSTRPETVQIIQGPDADTLQSWADGLEREEYNVPSVCIKFKDKTAQVQQVVPREFVAGHFHAWVTLGPTVAWERISTAFVISALVLAGADIIFFYGPGGHTLSTCDDVRAGRCAYLHVNPWEHLTGANEPIQFRPSIGPLVATLGCLAALVGTVGLQVARTKRDTQPEDGDLGLWTCPCAYMVAFVGGSWEVCVSTCRVCRGLLSFTARSIWQSCCSTCGARKRSAFAGRRSGATNDLSSFSLSAGEIAGPH